MILTIVRSFAVAVATTWVAVAAAAASQLLPGDQSRWSLDFRAAMEQTSAPLIEVHMIGEWTSTITGVRAGEFDAQLGLAKVRIAGAAAKSASPAALADLQTRLSRPFWATYRSDGGLIAIHFFREVRPSDRNLLQMIASELQLVRPDSDRASWTSQERDGAGEYSALYLKPQRDRILKRKLKYLYTDGVAGAPADAMSISVDQSEIAFSITSDDHVKAVDGANRVRMSLSQDKSQQLSATTEFHASHLQIARAPELVGSLERSSGNVVDSPIVTQHPDLSVARSEEDIRLLKGNSTDTLLGSAFNKASSGYAQPDRLTALFRSRPDAAAKAEILLIKNGPQKTVTNALGASGSPDAITVLSELARNGNLATDLRTDAILAFVQIKHPSVGAMRVPVGMLNDPNPKLQSAAQLISGALSRLGRAEHPAEADALDASLLARYQNSQDDSEKANLLGALGNSVGDTTLPTIERALGDPAVPIRAAAARALRLATGAHAEQSLATAMVSDSDPQVRADAIFATRFRRPLSPALANALLQAARTDQINYVRGDALAVLRQNPDASPDLSRTLAQIAESDVDLGIRRRARSALAAIAAPAQP